MMKTTISTTTSPLHDVYADDSEKNGCLEETQPNDKDVGCFWCGKPSMVTCQKCNEASYCSKEHLEKFHLYQDNTTNKIIKHVSSSKTTTSSNNNEEDSSQSCNTNKNKGIQKSTLNGYHISSSSLSSPSRPQMCLPYKISFTNEKGRIVVATRDIKPLELIMSDEPFVIGPSRQQQIVCVECLVPVDGNIRCKDCNFPLCHPECALKSTTQWHKSLECPYLKSIDFHATDSLTDKVKVDASSLLTDIPFILVELASIAPMRLLLKGIKGETSTREKFANKPLYDYCSPKQSTVRISAFESDMLCVIWDGMKMKDCIKDVDTVRTTIGQLFNNAKSLEKQGHNSSGLYGRYAMINHACVSNAKVVVGRASSKFTIQVRAQVSINKGEEITTRYVGITNGVPLRAEMLREHWCFTCSCARCMDPTELGSYSSAILCKKCMAFNEGDTKAQGLLLPDASFSSSGALGSNSSPTSSVIAAAATKWKCNTCGSTTPKDLVEKIIEAGLRCIR